MAYYVWSPISFHDSKDNHKVLDVGEVVTADKINVDKATFEELKEAGAIRDRKYPSDTKQGESPRERNIRKFAEAVEEVQANAYDQMPDLLGEESAPTPTAKDAVEI